MITFLRLFVLALILQFNMLSSASAQDIPVDPASSQDVQPTQAPGNFFTNMYKGVLILKSKMNSTLTDGLYKGGFDVAQKVTPWALSIGGSLALVYLIYECLGIFAGRTSATQVVFDIGLPAVLCSYLILNYNSLMTDFGGQTGFLSNIRNLGGDPISAIVSMYADVFTMISRAIVNTCQVFYKAVSIFAFGSAFVALLDALLSVIFCLGIIALCLIGFTDLIGLVLLGPFLGAIGIAFGPIFIAGLVTPWTRDYFSKWLGFTVASAVVTGVLGVCTTIASSLFGSFGFASYAGVELPTSASLLIVAVIIMSINSLITQVPQIASALVPGSIGASKGAGAALRQGGNDMKDKAKNVGSSAKGVYDAAKSRMRGGSSESSTSSSSQSPAASPKWEVVNGPAKYPMLDLN